jgi:hypothetical protein
MSILKCSKCKDEFTQLETVITFHLDMEDEYKTKSVRIGEFHLPLEIKYSFRSLSNIHLVYRCNHGMGCFFILSFDGHKGSVYVNENELINELSNYLNERQKLIESINLEHECIRFFIEKQRSSKKGE